MDEADSRQASAEDRFAAEVLRQARLRPHLSAEEIASMVFAAEVLLEDAHVDIVARLMLNAGLNPDGDGTRWWEVNEEDHEALVIELMEQTDAVNHGRTRSGNWQPLEPVEVDDSIKTDSGVPAVFSAYGEPSPKQHVEPRKHGTAYTYEKLGCRCEACREWKRARNAKQYAERKARR